MKSLKNKYLFPVILAGFLGGYGIADWAIPKYFHPTTETRVIPSDILAAIGIQPNYSRQTVTGNYLAGHFAQNNKDWDGAYDYISRVLKQDPENFELKKHAMVLAMADGDVKRAYDLANEVVQKDPENLLAVLFIALNQFNAENYQEAITTLDMIKNQSVSNFLIPVLKLWAQAGIKQTNVEDLPPSSFYAYHALLIYYALDKDETLLNYAKNTFSLEDADLRDAHQFADLLAILGEREAALELYLNIATKGFANEVMYQKIVALKQNQSIETLVKLPQIKTAKQGAAIVFFDMATILFREFSDDSATIFAQMALHLSPDLDKNMMILAAISARHERYEDAIQALQKIQIESKYYNDARRQIAELYTEQEQDEKAIEILLKLYEEHQDLSALIQAGDVYRYQENFTRAVEIYSNAIDKIIADDGEVGEKYWSVLYARGIAYERLKEFKKSEDDLKAALNFRPNDPYLLNYLGYSWADQGINLDQSLAMIMRAVQAQPDDGYIADSLGWVFYKMNDFEAALPHLEHAVELLPYDATINDHLGDAYWQVGRKVEAKFQWQRAFNYSEPSEQELKETIADKLANGIEKIEEKPLKIITEITPENNGI